MYLNMYIRRQVAKKKIYPLTTYHVAPIECIVSTGWLLLSLYLCHGIGYGVGDVCVCGTYIRVARSSVRETRRCYEVVCVTFKEVDNFILVNLYLVTFHCINAAQRAPAAVEIFTYPVQ